MSERRELHLRRIPSERRDLPEVMRRSDQEGRDTSKGIALGRPDKKIKGLRELAKRPGRGEREGKREKRGGKREREIEKRDSKRGAKSGDKRGDKRGAQRDKSKARRGKKSKSKSREQSFSVWRAVNLFPRPSRTALVSTLIYGVCLFYIVNLIPDVYDQLQLNVDSEGVKRTFYARETIAVPLPQNAEPVEGQVLDRREIELWPELAQRAQLNLKSTPPLIKHKDPLENYRAWLSALEDRRVYVTEGMGPGDATMISLIWPPAPAPQPTLIIGQAFDQIAWIDPKLGVVLSPVPESWREARALRIPRPIGMR